MIDDKMTEAEYFAHPALNQSAFKNFLVSPKHYEWHKHNRQAPSKELVIGSLAHLLLLEPESFKDRVHMLKAASLSNKEAREAREFYKKDPRKIIAPSAWVADVETMIEESEIRKVVEGIPADRREIAAFNTILGQPVKAKADWIDDEGYICDLKTTDDLETFRYTWKKYGYDIQAEWYLLAFREMDPEGFKIYPLGKKRPHDYEVFRVDEEDLARVKDMLKVKIPEFRACQEADLWPGKSKDLQTLGGGYS